MLNWQEQKKNAYPNIILSDCTIDEIYVDNHNIILQFIKQGFVIKDNVNSRYYRTKSAQVVIEECDIDNILVQYVHVKSRRGHRLIKVVKDIEFNVFLGNLLNHKWKYEIVEEYYSELGGLFIGKIKDAKNSMWCYMKLQYKDIIYFWDEINYEAFIN